MPAHVPTVDVPGTSTGRPISPEPAAILRAAEEFARQHDQSKLIPLLGTSDGFTTPEELDALRAA